MLPHLFPDGGGVDDEGDAVFGEMGGGADAGAGEASLQRARRAWATTYRSKR